MTLYAVQKFLYELNRSEQLQQAYLADRSGVLEPYELTEEEALACSLENPESCEACD